MYGESAWKNLLMCLNLPNGFGKESQVAKGCGFLSLQLYNRPQNLATSSSSVGADLRKVAVKATVDAKRPAGLVQRCVSAQVTAET